MKISQTVSKLLSCQEILKRRRTDRRTDTQDFGRYNIVPRHVLWPGIKIHQERNYQQYEKRNISSDLGGTTLILIRICFSTKT